jgi:hypothetical protein
MVAGGLGAAGALFAAGWHFNHETSGPSPPTTAISTTTMQVAAAEKTAALPANPLAPTTTTTCMPNGTVVGTAKVGPDPSSSLSYVVSGTVTNGRNDAIQNVLIYLSIRNSSGYTDSSRTHLIAGVIPPRTTQTWSQPVSTASGIAIVAATIAQITYADLGC